ncbi:MAG: glycosyltransferase family 4 protein [Caldimonas sp.]|uniref:glycosyltransferase family 4 protein n=1 Tax=Caldimonas sp. TaxID=2838790 RepID=UPI003919CE82
MPRCTLLLPGDLDTPTGGYRYDRALVHGLRQAGWRVDVLSLPGDYPWPTAAAEQEAARAVAALPDGECVLADGLAFGALPGLAAEHAMRLRWVALVHHPLALETGLLPDHQAVLRDSEARALSHARRIVVTSPTTARTLSAPGRQGWGVPPGRVEVIEPGVAPAAVATGSLAASGVPRLLCVGSLSVRKGQTELIDALAGLTDLPWELVCAGSTTRDAETTRAVRTAIERHRLTSRVHLAGVVEDEALDALYATADLFVLPSWYEGYGMVYTEALVRGLPVVCTSGGASPETVPEPARLMVPPGDVRALREALQRWLTSPRLRARLAAGARQARERLPRWEQAVERMARLLLEVGVRP